MEQTAESDASTFTNNHPNAQNHTLLQQLQGQTTNTPIDVDAEEAADAASTAAAAAVPAAIAAVPKSVSWYMDSVNTELLGGEVAKKLKEGKLTSLAPHLESLPKQISTIIEKQAVSMLDMFLEIRSKSTPLARFGTVVVKKNGEEESYTPGCIRALKNPVTGSLKVRDSDDFKEIVSEFDELLKTFKTNGTNLLERAAKLEVKVRVKQLQELVTACAGELAVYFVVMECARIRLSKPDANFTMSHPAIGWKVALDYLTSFSQEELDVLKFATLDELRNVFTKVKESKGIAVGQVNISDDDKTVYKSVKEALAYLFPKMTFVVWKGVEQDEVLRTLNTEVSVMCAKKDQGQINADTVAAITDNTGQITQAAIDELVDKRVDKRVQKYLAQMKKNERKNLRRIKKPRGPPA